ncbi:MAG: SH3 domain-containing protein [Candidatus Rokubacteria bacterium]|nr:SH3 domain-containing protein [Candidatus Rokubacteria bacterium]
MALAGLGLLAVAAAVGAASSEFVRVKVGSANIRAGPGTTYQRLWSVAKNYPLRVVARRGRWLKTVDFDGYAGWIFARLTDARPAVVVRVERANLRSGPGTDYKLLSTEVAGVAFRVLSRHGRWLKVEHADGSRGWIYRSLVWGNRKPVTPRRR